MLVCGPCSKRLGHSTTCTWGVRKVRSSGVSKDELNRLKQRIDELENVRNYAAPQGSPATREESSSPLPPQPLNGGGGNVNENNENNENNAMMGLMEDEPQTSSGHYGDSSAKSFMNQIKSVMNQQASSSDSQTPSPSKRSLTRPLRSRRVSTKHLQDYVLPSRQRADHLLIVYWRLVNTLYPFLDTVEVKTSYQRLWTGEELGEEGSTFLCLLNMIFSIACNLDPGTIPSERARNAEAFYQRAREFLDLDLFQHRSILTVQCFLLLGQYLQSTNDPQQCWIFVGLAIRMAQSLGLDLASTSAEADSEHECEVLRRVWHGCVLMDRTLSMTFGRPAMITAQAAASVPRPSAHSESHSCRCFAELCSPDSSETSPHFFIEALKLYELMSETLLTLYNPALQEESTGDTVTTCLGSLGTRAVGNVLEMDKNLCSWSRGLPVHLRHDPSAVKSNMHQRQANVLWLRHHHIRILLFRPVLSRFCSPQEAHQPSRSLEDSLFWKIALQCSVSCVQTALETIEFLDTTMSGKETADLDDFLPAWWYSIFYLYTAATVLVAARLQPAIIAEVSEKTIMGGWHRVMKIFKHFSNYSKHATRCAAAVSVFFEQVLPQRLDNQRLSSQRQQNQRSRSATKRPQQQDGQDLRRPQNFRSASGAGRGQASFTDPSANTNDTATLDAQMISTGTVDVDGTQDWAFNNSYQNMGGYDPAATDYTSIVGLFDTSDIQVDLGGMSWLTSLPSQLYGNSLL